MSKLQLALDFGTRAEIKAVVAELSGLVDIIEVGTPLIIREGLSLVSELKQSFPEVCLLADLKIMDAGDEEARMAFEAGADIVTVMGVTNDSTIAAAVREGLQKGKSVLVDLMNVPDLPARAARIEQLGAAYLCVHTATDVQKEGSNPLAELEQLSRVVPHRKIAVAGGVNAALLRQILPFQPAIVIAGSAITKSADKKGTTVKLRKILTGEG